MVTLWESIDALKRFVGGGVNKPRMVAAEKGLLRGEPELLRFELVGGA